MTCRNVLALNKRQEHSHLGLFFTPWHAPTTKLLQSGYSAGGHDFRCTKISALVAKSEIPWDIYVSSKTVFIKKEEVTEKRIIGTRFVIAENGLADGFVYLEINEVISF